MSIRKRLFISNLIMVVMPIFTIVAFVFLLNIILGGAVQPWKGMHNGWELSDQKDDESYEQLIKLSSIKPEKLADGQYMKTIENGMQIENGGLIIRKDDQILYKSENIDNLPIEKLPSFGSEGYNPFVWFDRNQFTVWQHDFYFQDGTRGSIFSLSESGSFEQFARTFFPILFIGLLLIVVLTNIVLSYIVSKSILKPVDRLSEAAERISSGDLDFTIRSPGKDELSRLINSFDTMRGKLKSANDLREQYETNRKELIANISHDLKTPITSIRGYVEGIKDGVANTTEKLDRYLNTIQQKAKHMDHLIDELFLFSKLDVQRLPFHFEEVDLKAFFSDYVEEIRLGHKDQDVDFMLDEHAKNTVAMIDREKVIRVLDNITQNSMKYSNKATCKVTIRLIDRGDHWLVQLKDNGPGIPTEELRKIFDQFYRADLSRGTDTGGSGLGLAIASQIIEAHGGTIWAESSIGEGLTISFTLKKQMDEGEHHAENSNH